MIKHLMNNIGEKRLGTWCVLPSPEVVEILALAGFDFVIIDMEHGPIDYVTAQRMIMAAENHDCKAYVRIPYMGHELRALEIGAHGLVFPSVSNATQAQLAVANSTYNPTGVRGFSPYTRSAEYGMADMSIYHERENMCLDNMLLIEDQEGVKNLEHILCDSSVNFNVTDIYIGVYDLAQSMGHPGEPGHPDVTAKIMQVIEMVKETDLCLGTLAKTLLEISELYEIGFDFLCYKADCAIFAEASKVVTTRRKRQS